MGTDSIVLVTGANGQVGRSLRTKLSRGRFARHKDVDVRDVGGLREAARGAEVIIHLAAMTRVDDCEIHPELAYAVNSQGTRNVVDVAEAVGARVIYLSTDYVFDGLKRGQYDEQDEPRPLNVYGCSKLKGEGHVLRSEGNLVVRTSWVFGQGHNFVRSIVLAAESETPLTVVDDQWGRPTWAEDLAGAIVHLLVSEAQGIIHVTGDGRSCTWADLAEEVLAQAQLSAPVRRVDTETYVSASTRRLARRPANSVLSLANASRLRVPLQDWRTGVAHYVGGLT